MNFYEMKLPLAPRTTLPILEAVRKIASAQLNDASPQVFELESIITSLTHLPSRTETEAAKVKERRREKEVIRRRLSSLSTSSKKIRQAIEQVIAEYNGTVGSPNSFLQMALGE